MICNTSPSLLIYRHRACRGLAGIGHWMAMLAAVAVLLAGCVPESGDTAGWALAPVSSSAPAAPGSRYPNLASRPDGAHALQFSTWTGDGWTAPVTVSTGAGWFVNWADFVSVVPFEDGLWAAHWLEQRPGSAYSYDVRIAVSKDDGRSWSAPMSPHDDGTPTEHGFVSMIGTGDGLTAVWLDGRNTGGGDHDATHGSAAGAMTLRTAGIDKLGRIRGGETELDARACDCCQTDVA